MWLETRYFAGICEATQQPKPTSVQVTHERCPNVTQETNNEHQLKIFELREKVCRKRELHNFALWVHLVDATVRIHQRRPELVPRKNPI
jgi:hypothetical protein